MTATALAAGQPPLATARPLGDVYTESESGISGLLSHANALCRKPGSVDWVRQAGVLTPCLVTENWHLSHLALVRRRMQLANRGAGYRPTIHHHKDRQCLI